MTKNELNAHCADAIRLLEAAYDVVSKRFSADVVLGLYSGHSYYRDLDRVNHAVHFITYFRSRSRSTKAQRLEMSRELNALCSELVGFFS